MALTTKQRGVIAGMAGAAAVAVVAMAAAIVISPTALRSAPDILGRLSFLAAWDLLVVVWLLAAIGNLARHRFFTPADIDGGGLTAGTDTARINQSILQNTLEQVVLAVVIHAAAVVLLPIAWTPAIPVAAVLFAVGRLLFWRGYRGGAPARAAGFALTFYPTVLLFLIVVSSLLRAG